MTKRILLLTGIAVACLVHGTALAGPLDPPLPIRMWGLAFKHATVLYMMFAALVVFLACWVWGRGMSKDEPTRGQIFLEMVVRFLDDLTSDSLGTVRRGRKYFPYVATLFLFLWTSNMLGMVPIPSFFIGGDQFADYNQNGQFDPGEPLTLDVNNNGIYEPGFWIPAAEEPTTNMNVPLALGLLFVLLIQHGSAIRYQGLIGYFRETYFSPEGFIGLVMAPLNFVGKLAEIISISFRIFGNMYGSAVIIVVISGLVHYIGLPIFLYGFFGIFVGTIQAFVFTMLALTYVSSGAAEEVEED